MRRPVLLAATLAGVALCAAAPAPDKAKVGKKPEYKFESAVDNGLGVTSLESLRGKPTIFEFWGTY
jgi:hypothetical protein